MTKKPKKKPLVVVYAIVTDEIMTALDRFAKSSGWSRGAAVRYLLRDGLLCRQEPF